MTINKKPLPERRIEIQSLGRKIKVVIQCEVSDTKECFEDTFIFGAAAYDLKTALDNTMTTEEVLDRDDPQRNSDYFLTIRPEVRDDTERLTENEKRIRYENVRDYYRLLEDDAIVQSIVDSVPRGEDGGLLKRSYTRIACSSVVSYDYKVFKIIGYAREKHLLQIYGKWMELENELDYIGNDFFSINPMVKKNNTVPLAQSIVASFSYCADPIREKTINLNAGLVLKEGILYLGETPVSAFKCLKKESEGKYSIVVDDRGYQALDGTEINGSIVENELVRDSWACSWLESALSCLKKYGYAIADEDRCTWQKSLKEKAGDSSTKKWPAGVDKYNSDFSKEQSLEKLLLFVDKICSYTCDDLLAIINRLPLTKNKKNFSPNKNYRLLTSDFFVPGYTEGNTDVKNMLEGGVLRLVVRTPMNAPLRNVRFVCSKQRYTWTDIDIELP